jgi:ferrochelatase
MLMGGYIQAIEDARTAMGPHAPTVAVAGPWHDEPAFIDALVGRIRKSLDRLDDPDGIPVLLTAHSLPRRVAEQEPAYISQLQETARVVAQQAGLSNKRWRFCWQSAGHEPGEWMAPDFADLMPELAREGHSSVLVAPVQFLADHLEILYDIDVGAREQAEHAGLAFARIDSPNDHPRLIAALATVARRTINVPTSGIPA